jgi:transcription antitermination factor NusG
MGVTGTAGCAPPATEPPDWATHRYATIWPRWVECRKIRNKDHEIVRSFASGMVLVRFEAADPQAWHDVRSRCGDGTRFIGGEYPDPVPEIQIEKLMREALSPDGLIPKPTKVVSGVAFELNELVRMTHSLFEGLIGRVVWVDEDGGGHRISLTFFNRIVNPWFPVGVNAFEKLDASELEPGSVSRRRATKAPQYGGRNAERRIAAVG